MNTKTPVEGSTRRTLHSRILHLLPWGLVLLAGFMLSLSFPNEVLPAGFGDHPPWALGWLSMLPLMWALNVLRPREAVWAGWLFSLSFFFNVLSWMRLFDVLPWIALALFLSPWIPLAIWLSRRMHLPPWLSPLGLATAWVGTEWLRSRWIFGFSWGEVGASQVDGPPAVLASLGSVYLISFMMIWSSDTLVQWFMKRSLPRLSLPFCLTILLVCLLIANWQVQVTISRWHAQSDSQVFSVIQPSVLRGLTPAALVTPEEPEETQQRLNVTVALSRRSQEILSRFPRGGPAIIVLPESVTRFPATSEPLFADLCRREHCYLLAGTPAYPPPDYKLHNSAYLLGPLGMELGRYDKIHLVPFGEFVPFRRLINWLRHLGIVPDVRDNDIQAGRQWKPVVADTHQLGVGICFESTFPDISRSYARQGAQYLIFITNDAWFHNTPAVRQHFNHARFRALETGLPVIRAASTGISGIIAPDGSIQCEIPTDAEDYRTLNVAPGGCGTFYTRFGWVFAPLCLFVTLFLCGYHLVAVRISSDKRT